MSLVSITELSKQFRNTLAVQDINLEIRSGEFFSILGPSGCGKTTLLRMIAGFENPTTGSISINGKDITRISPQQRGIGMVFQNYALFPHMTVFENIAFGLKTKNVPVHETGRRVDSILDRVHLLQKKNTPVPELSGGEQQRVAVARALVVEPAVILMDEPLSNLDVALRLSTREEIRMLQRQFGITTIYVTHDQSEAMSLSDRIAILRAGLVEQTGTPVELYESPASLFVAEFLGGANTIKGKIISAERKFVSDAFILNMPPSLFSEKKEGEATLVIRPEAVVLLPLSPQEGLAAKVLHKEYLGFIVNVVVETNGVTLHTSAMSTQFTKDLNAGDNVRLNFDWSKCLLLQ